MKRLAWAGACLFLACGKPETKPVEEAREAPAEASDGPFDAGISAEVGAAVNDGGDPRDGSAGDGGPDLAAYASARPVWGKSIGHTSVVFKLKLEGGAEAAYKPRSKRGKARYRGEIAAYRLGRALGLTNVPPALPRSFSGAELRLVLGDPTIGAGKLFADEVVLGEQGQVEGAIIPWIVGLKFLPLEAEPKRAEWKEWLSGPRAVPEEEQKLAGAISTMIVFDYLTGNWDRWSGGNIGTDEKGQALLFIDNDGAFYDPPPPEPLEKQKALLKADARFSKSFIHALRAFDPEAAKAAMGDEKPGEPLLSAKVLAGLEERRKDALAIIDARVKKVGEDRVLIFE
jgi:hypothetical protein